MFEWIKSVIESSGYVGIAFFVFLENVFPPIPSELIIPFGGFLVTEEKMVFSAVVLASTIGSVVGALPLFYLGKYWNRDRMKHFFRGKGKWLMVDEDDVDRSFDWFNHRGSWTVFVCRMIPGLRSYISIPAGTAGMPMLKFLALTTAGSAIWNTLLVWLGKMLGENYEKIGPYVDIAVWIVTLAVIGSLVWWIVKQRRKQA